MVKVLETWQVVYRFIVSYKFTHDGNSPTLRQIMAGSFLGSPSAVEYQLKKLEAMKLIKRRKERSSKRQAAGIEISGGRWMCIRQETKEAQ